MLLAFVIVRCGCTRAHVLASMRRIRHRAWFKQNRALHARPCLVLLCFARRRACRRCAARSSHCAEHPRSASRPRRSRCEPGATSCNTHACTRMRTLARADAHAHMRAVGALRRTAQHIWPTGRRCSTDVRWGGHVSTPPGVGPANDERHGGRRRAMHRWVSSTATACEAARCGRCHDSSRAHGLTQSQGSCRHHGVRRCHG